MFYQLIEKNGERRGVYSSDDLKYMLSRGWKTVNIPKHVPELGLVTPPQQEPIPQIPVILKRGPGRPRKVQ